MEIFSLELLLVVLLVTTVLTLLLYLGYSGLFTSITVSALEPDIGPITLAYKTAVGPYKNAGDLFTESFCLLPDREQLGIYYDDPEGVASAELRCAVGPVLAKGGDEPDPQEMEKMRENGFKIVHLPKPSYVVTASFPFTTTFSIYLGIYRVYPRLRDFIAERKLCAYPALEMYSDSSIVFMMPLSRQDEFFVAEFQEDEVSIATTDVGESEEKDAGSSRPVPEVSRGVRDSSERTNEYTNDEGEDVDNDDDEELEEEGEKVERGDSAGLLTGGLARD
jgi:hypothetical protein